MSARPAPPVRRAGPSRRCGLRARLRVAHRQGITHVPITALAIFRAFWQSCCVSCVRMFVVSRIDGSGNSLKKRQRTTVGNVTPLQSTVDLPTPAGAASEKATRRERGPARQCVPVDSTESFEIVPVTLWSLCRAPGLLGLLSVGGVSVVLCLSVARIQCAREERERIWTQAREPLRAASLRTPGSLARG